MITEYARSWIRLQQNGYARRDLRRSGPRPGGHDHGRREQRPDEQHPSRRVIRSASRSCAVGAEVLEGRLIV